MAGMTETEWLECIYPETMLTYLGARASVRKRRLFACACVRRIWPLLTDRRLRRAVRRAERFADGQASEEEMQSALRIVNRLREELEEAERRRPNWTALAARSAAQAVEAVLAAGEPVLEKPRDLREAPDVISASRFARVAARAAEALREEINETPPSRSSRRRRLASLDAVELVREVFGNPFRPVAVDPAWLAWNNNTVLRMARVIYDDRRLRHLPVLADALEEAGCDNVDLLAHCRAAVEHVRGCWVTDALLGMK
jgi:hypothetical protein